MTREVTREEFIKRTQGTITGGELAQAISFWEIDLDLKPDPNQMIKAVMDNDRVDVIVIPLY